MVLSPTLRELDVCGGALPGFVAAIPSGVRATPTPRFFHATGVYHKLSPTSPATPAVSAPFETLPSFPLPFSTYFVNLPLHSLLHVVPPTLAPSLKAFSAAHPTVSSVSVINCLLFVVLSSHIYRVHLYVTPSRPSPPP